MQEEKSKGDNKKLANLRQQIKLLARTSGISAIDT